MNFGLFHELYEEANTYKDVDAFINSRKDDATLKAMYDNVVLLLRFIYDIARMNIKDIREYLGMTRPMFCEYYEIKMRTLEDWEYGKNPVSPRLLKLLSYTLIVDFMN